MKKKIILASTLLITFLLTGCHAKKETKPNQSNRVAKTEFVNYYRQYVTDEENGKNNHHEFTVSIPKIEFKRGEEKAANSTIFLKDLEFREDIITEKNEQFSLGKGKVKSNGNSIPWEKRCKGTQILFNAPALFASMKNLGKTNVAFGAEELSSSEIKKITEIEGKVSNRFLDFNAQTRNPIGKLGEIHELAKNFLPFLVNELANLDQKAFRINENGELTCTIDKKALLAVIQKENSPVKIKDRHYKEKCLQNVEECLQESFAEYKNLRQSYKDSEIAKGKEEAEKNVAAEIKAEEEALDQAKDLRLVLILNKKQKTVKARLKITTKHENARVSTEMFIEDKVLARKSQVKSKMPEDAQIIKNDEMKNLAQEIENVKEQ